MRRRARSRSTVPDDQLGDERVVDADDLRPLGHAGVDAHARPGRLAVGADRAGRGQEPLGGVLGVDPALDRVPGEAHVLLPERERLAGGDQHLLAHEVDAGDELGDRVLDLDAGVHLEEEVLAFAVEEALDRPRPAVADRPGRVDGDGADPLAQLRRRQPATASPRRASGGGAGSCSRARPGGRPCRGRPRAPAPRRAAGLRGSARRRRSRRRSTPRPRGAPRRAPARPRLRSATTLSPLPPPPAEALIASGHPCSSPSATTSSADSTGSVVPGMTGHAGLLHQPPRRHLRAHRLDRLRRRADPDEAGTPRPRARRRRSRPGSRSRGGSPRRRRAARPSSTRSWCEVALGRRAGPEQVRLVGGGDVQRAAVGLRVDGDGADPELAQGAEDTDGDLAAIGDQDLGERRHEGAFSPLAARHRADRVRAYALAVTFADQLTVASAAAVPAWSSSSPGTSRTTTTGRRRCSRSPWRRTGSTAGGPGGPAAPPTSAACSTPSPTSSSSWRR